MLLSTWIYSCQLRGTSSKKPEPISEVKNIAPRNASEITDAVAAAVEDSIYLSSCKSTRSVSSISGNVACILLSYQPDEYLCNKPYIINLHVYSQQKN